MTWALLVAACTSEEPNDDDVFVPPAPRTTPYVNVFMISIDTTRRDHVDRYATDGVERMPFLSALLEAGSNADLPADTYDLDGDSNTAEDLPVDANGDQRPDNVVIGIPADECVRSHVPRTLRVVPVIAGPRVK